MTNEVQSNGEINHEIRNVGSAVAADDAVKEMKQQCDSAGADPPPMRPMKMMFKKLPLPCVSASIEASESSEFKRELEPEVEPMGPPLKKMALRGLHQTAALDCSLSCKDDGLPPSMATAAENHTSHSSTTFNASESSTQSPMHPAEPCHSDSLQLQRRLKELEADLFYSQADLQHEEARWAHFRRCAQRNNIWAVLMGISEFGGSDALPLRQPSQNEGVSTLEMQLERAEHCLAEEVARTETLSRELERLAGESQELQRKLILQKVQDALVADKVLEHPLYKKVLACYHQERAAAEKMAQQLDALQSELNLEGRRCRSMQESLEDQEKRRRKKLEQMLYERDHRLLEKEALIKDLGHRLKKLEGTAEQAVYEQQKLKEYPLLVTSLKKELERARHRLDKQRREHKEEDLATEVESISKAYEDMSEQNGRLLSQLDEKDRLNNSLLTEKLKNQHTITLLKGEVEASTQALELNEKLRANQESWMLKMQDVLQTFQNEEKQLSHKARDFHAMTSRQDRELATLRLENEELRHQVACHQEASEAFTEQAEQLVRQTSENADDSRRKGEELQRLQAKYELLLTKAAESAANSKPCAVSENQEVLELREQVLGLRAVLNCNVCGRRRKNTILTRCLHIFCAECVDDNLRDRKRKCPQCAMKFAESDVKPVFLCEK